MHNNIGSTSNSSGSRYLNSFFPERTHSRKVNEVPPSKKPKLDVTLSQTVASNKNVKTNADTDYDEWWGDDADLVTHLSQIPETTMHETNTNNVTAVPFQGSSVPGNINRPVPSNNSNFIPTKKSPAGVPLRRTASSGWPSSNILNKNGGKTPLRNYDQLHIEVNKLKEELTKKDELLTRRNEELTRKSGEVHLLRDKYNHVQQELDKQKRDNLDKLEKLKHEAELNSLRLSREVKSLQSQLDVKDMEIDSAERRTQHLTSVNKLLPESPSSFRPNINRPKFSPARVNNNQFHKEDVICGRSLRLKSLPLELLQEIITPELLKPSPPETTITESVCSITNTGLFLGPKEFKPVEASTSRNLSSSIYVTANSSINNILSAACKPLSAPCSSVELCALALLSSDLLDVASNNTHQVICQVLTTCAQILKHQLHQLNSAVCPQKQYIEREREIMYNGLKYLDLSQNYDLLSSQELYNDERGICARRALALLSLLVTVSNFAAEEILPRHCPKSNSKPGEVQIGASSEDSSDTHQMLIIIKEIIHQIEKQRRTLMFEGFFAAATAVIKNLLQTDISLPPGSQEIILDILKLTVFARPGSLVVENILRALLAATKYPAIMNRMCHNADTCLLQVLCMLIRVLETPKKHILSDVFTSLVLTLFYGVEQSPKWLFSIPSQTSCQCRRLISRLTFTLLGEACSTYPLVSPRSIERMSLDMLFSRGILLVCTLLYHDENFGANVDPDSVGYYELFLHSTFRNMDKRHNKACWDILDSLWCQEEIRQPMRKSDGRNQLLSTLSPLFPIKSSKKPRNVLDSLDAC